LIGYNYRDQIVFIHGTMHLTRSQYMVLRGYLLLFLSLVKLSHGNHPCNKHTQSNIQSSE